MKEKSSVIQFPGAGAAPAPKSNNLREIGVSALARQLGAADEYLGGHWCSRCKGVWYGLPLEVECPVCGNRNG